jgi:hypothetical protein
MSERSGARLECRKKKLSLALPAVMRLGVRETRIRISLVKTEITLCSAAHLLRAACCHRCRLLVLLSPCDATEPKPINNTQCSRVLVYSVRYRIANNNQKQDRGGMAPVVTSRNRYSKKMENLLV